jgi:NCS2 family nucleobase:cation symporter-2
VVLAIILLLLRFTTGFLHNISVLIGIVAGYLITIALGWPSFAGIEARPWIAPVIPFHFGMPVFDIVACLSMCLVMIVTMVESTGMFFALGEMVGETITQKRLASGLRADGLGTLIGGIFNTFPYTSFSQNVGLVAVTGVRSRFICVTGGVIMIVLGLLPKMAFLVERIPTAVLGGAGIVMFGMVAATGIRILSRVDYQASRGSQFIVAISIGFGMIPLVTPTLFSAAPEFLKTVLDSGILLATIASLLLNLYFNGVQEGDHALADAKQAAAVAEAG